MSFLMDHPNMDFTESMESEYLEHRRILMARWSKWLRFYGSQYSEGYFVTGRVYVSNVHRLGLARFIEDESNCKRILEVLFPCNPPTVLERARGKIRASPAVADSTSDGVRVGVSAPPGNQINRPSNVSSSIHDIIESDGTDIENQLSSGDPSAGKDVVGGFDDDNAQDPSSSRGPSAGRDLLGGNVGFVGGFDNGNDYGRGFPINTQDPSSSRGPSVGKCVFGGNVSSEREFYNAQNRCFDIENPNDVDVNRITTSTTIHHLLSQPIEKLRESDDSYIGELAKLGLGICASAVYSLAPQALKSPFSWVLICALGANGFAFFCVFTYILLRQKRPEVAAIAGKIGVTAMAIGVLLGVGMLLPEKYVWINAITCLFPAVASLFG